MSAVLGDLIKRRRADLGLTQVRLAELVGKSASAVRSWEKDRAVPKDAATRSALAAVLGLSDEDVEAAIAGADVSFFSDPGRPIATDPNPTIIQPRSDAAAIEAPEPFPIESAHVARIPESVPEGDPLVHDLPDTTPPPPGSRADTTQRLEDDVREADRDAAAEQAAEPLESAAGVDPDAAAETRIDRPDPEAAVEVSPGRVDPLPTAVVARPGASAPSAGTRLAMRPRRGIEPDVITRPAPTTDPVTQDAWLYRRRLLLFALAVVGLVIVLRWAVSGIGEAIAEVLDNLRAGL